MTEILEYFHFLRPAWLLAILPLLGIWWYARPKSAKSESVQTGLAPHLAEALEVGQQKRQRFYAIDGVALMGVLLSVAAAGPTWSRVPNPLVADTAPLVVALKVTPSMETPDLAPTRLDRAKFKVLDLVQTRAGARTGLVAYSGTAHRVAPLTEDPNILRPLLEGLSPAVMPVEGNDAGAALSLAVEILATAEDAGAILFALDDLDPVDVATLNASGDTPRPPIIFLAAAPERMALPQLDRVTNATVVRISPDDTDLTEIERALKSVHRAALAGDDRLQWDDRGWWLAWPVALLVALWFRQGWTMRWGAFVATLLLVQTPGTLRAEGWVDWFLTADQQGRLAYEDKRFADAGDLFEDAMWRGYAKYRAGQYEEAIQVFQRLDTAEAAFAQGMAEIKSRQYRPAVRSFEAALVRQPDFPEAERNRKVAEAIVEYVEDAREQSDTGEESGIGADEVVFDNEAARGAETQIEAPQEDAAPLTTDQWIQAIDTDMRDFLRSRFLLENATRDE